MKLHMSLPVSNIEATQKFYEVLFGAPPSKTKIDYLKFEPPTLALNISFVRGPVQKRDTERHLGLQFENLLELDEAHRNLNAAGLVHGQRNTSICCYANQDKFWVKDPDGYQWELYYLLTDSEIKIESATSCCDNHNSEKEHSCG